MLSLPSQFLCTVPDNSGTVQSPNRVYVTCLVGKKRGSRGGIKRKRETTPCLPCSPVIGHFPKHQGADKDMPEIRSWCHEVSPLREPKVTSHVKTEVPGHADKGSTTEQCELGTIRNRALLMQTSCAPRRSGDTTTTLTVLSDAKLHHFMADSPESFSKMLTTDQKEYFWSEYKAIKLTPQLGSMLGTEPTNETKPSKTGVFEMSSKRFTPSQHYFKTFTTDNTLLYLSCSLYKD